MPRAPRRASERRETLAVRAGATNRHCHPPTPPTSVAKTFAPALARNVASMNRDAGRGPVSAAALSSGDRKRATDSTIEARAPEADDLLACLTRVPFAALVTARGRGIRNVRIDPRGRPTQETISPRIARCRASVEALEGLAHSGARWIPFHGSITARVRIETSIPGPGSSPRSASRQRRHFYASPS